jgi:hypothetical protein
VLHHGRQVAVGSRHQAYIDRDRPLAADALEDAFL